jgi:hypothetical protein
MVNGFDVRNNSVYTKVLEYRKDGSPDVVFICTAHIGTRTYYRELEQRVDRIKYGIYEGVGIRSKEADFFYENVVFPLIAEEVYWLGLVYQSDFLKVNETSWINPDAYVEDSTVPEWRAKMEGLLRFGTEHKVFSRLAHGSREKIMEMHRKNLLWELELYFFEPSLMRGWQENTPTLDYRNELLASYLEELIQSGVSRKIGVVYGAGHLKAVHPFLEGLGYRLGKCEEIKAFGLYDPIEGGISQIRNPKKRYQK